MIFNHNGTVYEFPEPTVTPYFDDGILVSFCDGSQLKCDDVTGYGGDTCVSWGSDTHGHMVGSQEGVFTKDDYITYCKNLWKHRVETKLDNAARTIDFFGGYKKD
jgi:hypothetical protein